MKKVIRKVFSLFKNTSPSRKVKARKFTGQSMVEVAITLPILLTLFIAMIEYGFLLNTYLTLLDATRQTARALSNKNPFKNDPVDPTIIVDDPLFYSNPTDKNGAVDIMQETLYPTPSHGDPRARVIQLKPTTDDILVTVVKVSVSDSTHQITQIERFPKNQPQPFFQYYGNQLSPYRIQGLTDPIQVLMTKNGQTPVRTGLLIVEVYYGYDGILKLFIRNTIMLHTASIMPLVAAKPPRTP